MGIVAGARNRHPSGPLELRQELLETDILSIDDAFNRRYLAEESEHLKKAQREWFRAQYGRQRWDLIVAFSGPPPLKRLSFGTSFPWNSNCQLCAERDAFGARSSPIIGIVGHYAWRRMSSLYGSYFPTRAASC